MVINKIDIAAQLTVFTGGVARDKEGIEEIAMGEEGYDVVPSNLKLFIECPFRFLRFLII